MTPRLRVLQVATIARVIVALGLASILYLASVVRWSGTSRQARAARYLIGALWYALGSVLRGEVGP